MRKQKVFGHTKSIRVFGSMMWSLIKKLDMEYWATHCGNDGYLYLLFQRRFLKLCLSLSAISIFITIPMNFYFIN